MSVLIKAKSGRFRSVNLQNRDAKSFTFKEVNKQGCLNGYIRGVVYKKFPVFEHCLYGKLLKMILIDKNDLADDSSDDDVDVFQYPELSFFTRGEVAELCSTIRKGDVVVLEQPFVERVNKANPVYHLAGDKRLSDISVWVLKKKGPLLIVKGHKTEAEIVGGSLDTVGIENDKSADSPEEEVGDQSNKEQLSPSILQGKRISISRGQSIKKHVENDSEDFVPARVTRSGLLPTNNTSRVTRSTNCQHVSKSLSTNTEQSEIVKKNHDKSKGSNKSTSKSRKITKSVAAKELTSESTNASGTEQSNKSIKSPMVLRNKEKLNEHSSPSNQNTMKGNHSESPKAKGISEEKNQSPLSEEEQSDKYPPVCKKSKRKLFGPKGVSSTPKENPKICNVVLESIKMKRSNAHIAFSDETSDDESECTTRTKKKSGPDQRNAKGSLQQTNKGSLRRSPRSHLQLPSVASSCESNDNEIIFKSYSANTSKTADKSADKSQNIVQPQNGVFPDEESSESNQSATPSRLISPKRKRLNSDKNEMDNSAKLVSPRKSPRLHGKLLKNNTSDNLLHQVQDQSSNAVCSDIEMSQESNSSSQPQTPSGLLQTNTHKLTSRHNQGTESPSTLKNLRSNAEGHDMNKNKHEAKKDCPANRRSPRLCSKVQDKLSNGVSIDESTQKSEEDSQTISQQSTPSGMFHTMQKLKPEVAECQSHDTHTASTCNAQNTSNTSTTQNSINVNAFRDSYQVPSGYTKLSNLQLNTATNLYGVVKYFKPPWKSRGTDMCSVVVLADPSTDEQLECVIFNKNAALLPQVRRIGDIVRLHRVNIKKYKDKFQGLSARGFSSIVFDRDVALPVSQDAARFSSSTFTFGISDINMVKTLKEWRISQDSLFEPAKVLTVSEVQPDLYFDIVCQVKGLSKQNNLDCVCLKATDGTHPQYDIKNCDDDDGYSTEVSFDPNLCQFTTFDVFLYGEHAMLLLNMKVSDGCILMLHNVHSTVVQGGPGVSLLDVVEPSIELLVHRGSEYGRGLSILSHNSSYAQILLKRLHKTT